MKIFTLNENTQQSDDESYYHWYAGHIVEYYSTKELAKEEMNRLIELEEYNDSMAWDAKLGDGRNIISIQQGASNLEEIKVNKYFISEIEVIDK